MDSIRPMDSPIWRLPSRHLSYMVYKQGIGEFYHLGYGLDYQQTINRISTTFQSMLRSTI